MATSKDRVDLVPVSKATTAQSVAQQMLGLIRDGTWVAGDRLPTETELCAQLDVGRSTVREALQILATLRVVQPSPGLGTFVRAPTTADILRTDLIAFLIGRPEIAELAEAREMIEPTIARLAALRGTDADFARIEAQLDEHEAAHLRGEPVSAHGARFHLLLAETAHNPIVVIFLTSILEMMTQGGRYVDVRPDYQACEIDEHRDILAALRARDPDRAAEILRRHIRAFAETRERESKSARPRRAPRGTGRVR